MRRARLLVAALMCAIVPTSVAGGQDTGQSHAGKTAKPAKPETSHLVFVKEYIREITTDEELMTSVQKELSEDKTTDQQLSTDIYASKSIQLELRSQIAMLKSMRLDPPYETLIPDLVSFYQHQIELQQSLLEISSKFLAGPKPGVEYSALAAKMPQVRAELEATQKGVFEATPLVFMTLLDMKPDSQDHVSHLIITKQEKSDLQSDLNIVLKDQPDDKGDHDYYISAAMVLRAAFLKGYKCADEPWQ
jgi:hypothetical protein